MNKSNYSLEVLINGRPTKEYYKDQKSFIEGREGTRYTLKLRNNSWKRILAVFSVDGIEVIEGKVASEFKGGYIVDAFSSIEIKGYRIDEKSVAAFVFAKTHKSYSNNVGGASVNESTGETEYTKTTRNNGIIGVRVFEENIKDKNYGYESTTGSYYNVYGQSYSSGAALGHFISCSGALPYRTYNEQEVVNTFVVCATDYAAALNNINSTVNGSFTDETTRGGYAVAASSSTYVARSNVNQYGQLSHVPQQITAAPDFNLGTTWGEKVDDKVKEVKFDKSDTFTDIEIYYDSKDSLASYGIDFEATKQYVKWPSAFEEKKKFCKVPEGYQL